MEELKAILDIASLAAILIIGAIQVYVTLTPGSKDNNWFDEKILPFIPLITTGSRAKFVNGRGRVSIKNLKWVAKDLNQKAKSYKDAARKRKDSL